jgi:hypothetical protein
MGIAITVPDLRHQHHHTLAPRPYQRPQTGPRTHPACCPYSQLLLLLLLLPALNYLNCHNLTHGRACHALLLLLLAPLLPLDQQRYTPAAAAGGRQVRPHMEERVGLGLGLGQHLPHLAWHRSGWVGGHVCARQASAHSSHCYVPALLPVHCVLFAGCPAVMPGVSRGMP